MPSKPKTIEETYKKMSQREHVLHRPGMYIGSVTKSLEEMWTYDTAAKVMKKQMVEFTPGFLKIFDEVLTNALDHSTRDPTVDRIKIDFDQTTGEISVYNNGTGIPVVIHKEHNLYVPELIFGHLLSSSNYDDSDTRTGAGTNGIGIKAVSIYSKRFVIETVDSENKLKFIQEYTDNMSQKSKPKITKNSTSSYTKVTFLPDYTRFGMRGLETDTIGLLTKRVYDCIACTDKRVSIFLNGEKLKGKGLVDYAKYFIYDENDSSKLISESIIQKVNGADIVWEYIVVPWDRFEQVSFVNGNSTYAGGKHVDHIMYQITNRLKTLLETKKRIKDVKPAFIRERIFLFLRATVINPHFSSQTKEYLTTQVKDFRCKIEVSDRFIDRLWKSSIIDDVIQFCKLKESMTLAKTTDGKKQNKIYIPKLEDALWAGTTKSDKCTLILTEGDSAKTFALWGRSVVGPETLGIFPLKGKLLNIRDATVQQLINNEEINNLKQIIGLKQGKEYTNTSDLRYGKIMLLTDSDVDGSHIKGLLINFIHSLWPSLIKLDFIQTVRTPIVKAIRGKQVIEFFTEQDYEKWKRQTTNLGNYHIRYFKGLGTSTKEDAKSTFSRIEELRIDFFHKNKECDNAILLAFEKDKNIKNTTTKKITQDKDSNTNDSVEMEIMKCSDKRKQWLGNYNRESYINVSEKKVSYQDFINKELIHFSIYDNSRSIPSLCDGLKPSQRKIMYYMLQKNITRSMKVAQLSGYISAETSYHHGETSLQQAIIGLAQNFVGSNNINLLYPDGNHGCLDPDTEIIMWNGEIKKAKDIVIGDVLIGDDGTKRNVLDITSGEDTMYKITLNNDDNYTVNSQHILTLKYKNNKNIYWKESQKGWKVEFFNIQKMKECSKFFSTIQSSNLKNTYNKSKLIKQEAYNAIKEYVDNISEIQSPNDGIFDIKVEDFLKLPKYVQSKFYSIKNSSFVEWEEKEIPIDPYIFGCWLGDGNSDGSGITSIDKEVIKEWVIYLDKINCELTHDIGDENHGNYHYNVRKKGFGYKTSIGDKNHNSDNCIGCKSLKKSEVCDWVYLNKTESFSSDYIKKINEYIDKNDKYEIILKNGQTITVSKNHKMNLKFNGHKKIYWKESNKSWNVEYFDGMQIRYVTCNNIPKEESYILIKKQIIDIKDNNEFEISLEQYLNFPKTTQSKFISSRLSYEKNDWKQLLINNNLINNKHIPLNYIVNSKKNRLELLAGLIDTDGSVNYSKHGIPHITITQSKRLRYHIIKSIELLCKSLGFKTTISTSTHKKETVKGEKIESATINIHGNNLDMIPTRILRKKIIKYKRQKFIYNKHSFTIEKIGKGSYSGWKLDGNQRFLLNNFVITHNSSISGGKDAASARYIFTRLETIAKTIFHPDDNPLLNYLNDDGQSIEPEWYIPIIPMVLVNGCEGIGTGYSTYIPPHNPVDIIENIRKLIRDEDPLPMNPYFKNFSGTVEKIGETTYITRGKWNRLSDTQIAVTALPIGTWITPYKEFLESLIEQTGSAAKRDTKDTKDTKTKTKRKTNYILKDVQNRTKDESTGVHFIVEFRESKTLDLLIKNDTLDKELKLTRSFSTNNMYLFDDNLVPLRYSTTTDILLDFYDIRLEFYVKRKKFMIKKLMDELTILQSKIRFINEYISGTLDINRKSKDYIIKLLTERKFPKYKSDSKSNSESSETNSENDSSFSDYDYLIKMPIVSMTKERIEQLENQAIQKQQQLNDLKNRTEKQLWLDDLDQIEKQLV